MKPNIFNLNYVISSINSNFYKNVTENYMPKKGKKVRIKELWKQTKKDLKYIFHYDHFHFLNENKDKIWFFCATINQKNAIIDVYEKTTCPKFLIDESVEKKYFPWIIFNIFSWFFSPFLLFDYLFAKKDQKEPFEYFLDLYLQTYPYYYFLKFLFLFVKPKALVVANDHHYTARTLFMVANSYNIKTIYIQHANIGDYFPPLDFTYSFLEGADSLIKYLSFGKTNSQIYMTGMPKLDKYIKFKNRNTVVSSIGIATNELDMVEDFIPLIVELKKLPYSKIILRCHPADNRIIHWFALAQYFSIDFSDSRVENSFNYLSNIDFLIAGDSNIVLESVLLNVYTVYFVPGKFSDIYNFYTQKLITEKFTNHEELINFLSSFTKKPYIQTRARFYNSLIGSIYENMSSIIVAELLSEIFKYDKIVNTNFILDSAYPEAMVYKLPISNN